MSVLDALFLFGPLLLAGLAICVIKDIREQNRRRARLAAVNRRHAIAQLEKQVGIDPSPIEIVREAPVKEDTYTYLARMDREYRRDALYRDLTKGVPAHLKREAGQ